MFKIAKMEVFKTIKSKSFIKLLISLALIISTTISISYYYQLKYKQEPYLVYIIYDIFDINGKVFFPIVVIIYFASTIVNEFRYKTIKLQFSSTKYREELYIGQFLGAAAVFSIIFMGLLVISIIVVSLLTDTQNIFIEFYAFSYGEILLRFFIIGILVLLFMICLGSLAFMIATITENMGATIFLFLLINTLYFALPLPKWLSDICFLKGYFIYDMFVIYEMYWGEIFKCAILFFIYIIIFLGMGGFIFREKEI